MRAVIAIMPKREILDPQSRATADMLERLGFQGVTNLRQGKRVVIELEETDVGVARKQLEEMCATLLVNEIIEEYNIEMVDSDTSPSA